MSKISQYHNTSLLKSIRSLSIYMTESNKIIFLSREPKLLPYCTRILSNLLLSLQNFYPLQKAFYWSTLHNNMSRYWCIGTYVICSVSIRIKTLCINASQCRPSSRHVWLQHVVKHCNIICSQTERNHVMDWWWFCWHTTNLCARMHSLYSVCEYSVRDIVCKLSLSAPD